MPIANWTDFEAVKEPEAGTDWSLYEPTEEPSKPPATFTLGGKEYPLPDQSTRPPMPREVSEFAGLPPETSRLEDLKQTLPSPREFVGEVMEPFAVPLTKLGEEEIQRGMFGRSLPESYQELLGGGEPGTTAKIASGLTKAGLGLGETLISPLAVATAGAGALPKVAQRAVSAAFTADMASQVPEAAAAAGEAFGVGDAEAKAETLANLGVAAGFTTLTGLHAAAPRRPTIPPRIVEAIAKGDQASLTKATQAVADVVREQPKQEIKPDAIRESPATEGVLRQERPEVELQGVREPQVETAIAREPARGQGGEEGQVLLKDVAREKEIAAAKEALLESEDVMTITENPQWIELSKEFEAIKNRYEGQKPSDVASGRVKTAPKATEKFEVSVQAEDPAYPGTGFVQIVDTAVKAENVKSPTVESLRAAGMEVPDFSKLPTGKYTWKEAVEKAKLSERTKSETVQPISQPTETAPAASITPEARPVGLTGRGAVGERPVAVPEAVPPARALPAAEAKLAEVVNQTIEQASPTRLGVSPAATVRPTDVVLGAPDLRSISPAVEARWQAAVKGTETLLDRAKVGAENAWKSITREYADLPPREFPAEIDVLRRLRASRNASARTTVDVLKGITNNLGPKQYGVFNRVALLKDLVKDVEAGKYADGRDLPFGYKDAGELTADLNKFRSVSEATPQIGAALERRQEFMNSLRGTLVERGFLPESILQDPRYFHHQVLMYMAEKNAPTGSRSFRDWFSGWQKKRTGSSLDYNRQYVEAEAAVLSDAFNKITMQDLQGEMRSISDLTPQLKELHGAEWRQHIPKTHTEWQPKRGNAFYPVQTVAERVMDRYLSGLGEILPSEFKEALAVGGRRQEWVVPKPLAKVLDNIAPRPDNWIDHIAAAGVSSWKRYILLNPLRAAKYNLNNLSGDLDFLFAAQPKIFKEFKTAASDMWGFHVKGKSAVGDIKEAMQDGVIGSGWRASELPDIARSDYFNWLTGEKPKLVDRYWDWIGKRSDAREDTGRLASYRFAKQEWEAGRPFYGASVPADVNALATPRLKAAKVAREILIDYGRGTEFSNFTRQKVVPFFKWMEGNFVRYQQLIKNLPEQEGGGPRLAGATAKKAATLAGRMAFAYGVINLWNHLFFPDEEEELGEGRNQLHLILGRDDAGNIQSIRFQGALSDLLGWVGAENLPQDVEDLVTGKADVGDKMEDAYEAGISRAVNASQPFVKTAAEVGLGRSFYPNALEPRPVRDRAEHAAGLFSLKPVYQWLAGKPHKPLRKEIANLISYSTDPGEAAYNATRHLAGEFLEDKGEERSNIIPGQRSNALYYYKQALRYKDRETAQKFLEEYERLGGKREGLQQSIRASHPLSMLGNQRRAFIDSLSPQEQETVKRAEEWYRRVYGR